MTKNSRGGATGSVDYSPEKLRRIRRQMAKTEARWAAMASPVHVRRVGDPAPDLA